MEEGDEGVAKVAKPEEAAAEKEAALVEEDAAWFRSLKNQMGDQVGSGRILDYLDLFKSVSFICSAR